MFERMVRVIKRCLRKAIGLQKLTYEELMTVLWDIEAVINNRPLTYLDEDDQGQALTPSHLFCGRRTLDQPVKEVDPHLGSNLDGSDLAARTKQINLAVDHFWRRWLHEYLVELRESHKMKLKQKKINMQKGDVVLIFEAGVKRNKWPMGVINDVISGKDGVIRGAEVKKLTNGKAQVISRPIQKLYPLELNCSDHDASQLDPGDEIDTADPVISIDPDNPVQDVNKIELDNEFSKVMELKTKSRSKRIAAIDGQIRRRVAELYSERN